MPHAKPGCDICRTAMVSGGWPPPSQVAADPRGPVFLYRCANCGVLWERKLREASIITAEEAQERFPAASIRDGLHRLVEQLHQEFAYIKEVVEAEGELHHVTRMRRCEHNLRVALEEPEADERTALELVIEDWSSSLDHPQNPFYVWREDFDERLKANQELDRHKERVAELLEEYKRFVRPPSHRPLGSGADGADGAD